MEYEEEEVLSGVLLSGHLEVAVLKPLEVNSSKLRQEIEAELHRLDFFDD